MRRPCQDLHPAITQFLSAIAECIQKAFYMPALVLVHSLLDILAWLGRDPAHEDVTRHDFLQWVEKYLLPGTGLNCTALELYSARCALIHTSTGHSKLTRRGKAREISYAWGPASVVHLQRLLDHSGHPRIAIHGEALFEAVKVAIDRFMVSTAGDPRLCDLVLERLNQIYIFLGADKFPDVPSPD